MDEVRALLQLPLKRTTGHGVRVAVIDSGIDPSHPDFSKSLNAKKSLSFARLDSDLIDRHYHGTHVAGIIAGDGRASGGKYSGLAPSVELIVFKVATDDRMDEGAVAAGINAAIEARVDIINYSASRSPKDKTGAPPWIWAHRSMLEDLFEEAFQKGILCVVAAGNDGIYFGKTHPSTINRPGGSESVLTVGSVSPSGRVSQLSSRGPYLVSKSIRAGGVERFESEVHKDVEKRIKPDIVMPGEDVMAPRTSQSRFATELNTLPKSDFDDYYIPVSGTSQATAVASGFAACVLEEVRNRHIDLGPNQAIALKAIVMASGRRLGAGTRMEFGRGQPDWPGLLEILDNMEANDEFRREIITAPTLRIV